MSQHGPICCPDGIRGYGNPEYGVMFVGQNPAWNEMQSGLPFTGSDGELLNGVLKGCGWDREKVYCTNSCCVRDLSRIDICRERLIREINEFNPKLIVTLGATACENLWGMKISKCRGALQYTKFNGARGLATWLPSAILQADTPEQQNDYAAEFVRDIRKINRYFGPGKTPPTQVTVPYILISNISEAQRILDELPRDELVTIDIETPIFDKDAKEADPYHKILCVGVGLKDDVQYVFPEKIIGKLSWPKDVQWGGWNLYGFDMVGLRDRYGIELPVVHDGMLSSYVRDERTKYGTHKLKHNSREDAGADFYEEDDIRGSLDNLYKYNGFDVAYNHRVLRYHLSAFDDDDTKLYYGLLIPAANMYSEAQYYGCRVDLFKWFDLTIKFMAMEQQLREELTNESGITNPNSNAQVGHYLFDILGIDPKEYSHPTKGSLNGGKFAWSVDKNVLDAIDHPWAAKLRKYNMVVDTKSRYLDGVKAQIKHDGKVHPKCWIPGTTTGRPSYSDPPIQQLPHERTVGELSEVRSIFVPDSDDYIFLAADYSQIELWIMWAYSEDANLLADLTEPWYVTGKADYHSRTCTHGVPCDVHMSVCDTCYLTLNMCACLSFKPHTEAGCSKCIKWAYDRDNQKHVNFGIPYGETAYGLRRPPPIGTGLSIKENQKLIDNWYNRNKDVYNWQKAIEYQLRTKGFIKTPSGRKRRFPIVLNPKQIRQAINAPIQGTASDYTMTAAIELCPLIKPYDSRLVWTTHDEILLHVNRKHLDEVKSVTREVMQKPRFPGFPSIKVEMKEGNSIYAVSP